MIGLAEFLTTRGYVAIPLTRSAVGHFHTTGTLNGRPVEILVDTGASCTVVAMSLVQSLGLRFGQIDGDAGGAGGALVQFFVDGADLKLGAFAPHLPRLVGLDFEQINAPLRAQESTEVDMILGADVFDSHAAIIDYACQALYLSAVVVQTSETAT